MHTPNEINFGPGAEFKLIQRLVRRLGTVAEGIGDDAAILEIPRNHRLVASTDTSTEGIHFHRDWLSSLEIGYRAGTSAASDIAAMGAEGMSMLVSLIIPQGWVPEVDGISGGVGAAARAAGMRIVGGDTTKGDQLSITVTVLGLVKRPLVRSAARLGDYVYVTGSLGGPAAAVAAYLAGESPAENCRDRFVRPQARINEARWLAGRGAHAAIDISDGLLADLGHIAAASGVRIEVDYDSVPVLRGVKPLLALTGGEEYELAVTSSIPIDTMHFEQRFNIPLTCIGRVTDGVAEVAVLKDGEIITEGFGGGFDHFADT